MTLYDEIKRILLEEKPALGVRVTCLLNGQGFCYEVKERNLLLPIYVKFSHLKEEYTEEGKLHYTSKRPCLVIGHHTESEARTIIENQEAKRKKEEEDRENSIEHFLEVRGKMIQLKARLIETMEQAVENPEQCYLDDLEAVYRKFRMYYRERNRLGEGKEYNY